MIGSDVCALICKGLSRLQLVTEIERVQQFNSKQLGNFLAKGLC